MNGEGAFGGGDGCGGSLEEDVVPECNFIVKYQHHHLGCLGETDGGGLGLCGAGGITRVGRWKPEKEDIVRSIENLKSADCIFAFLKCVTSVGHIRFLPWPGKPSDMVLLLWFVVVLMACVAGGHLLVTTNTWKRKSQTRPPYLKMIGQ